MSGKIGFGKSVVKFGDFMCFVIYFINFVYLWVYKFVLEQFGLIYLQYVIIICLWEEDNQMVKGLSEKFFLELSMMMLMLKCLEGMGYVCCECDSEDECSVCVLLIDVGCVIREKVFVYCEVMVKVVGLLLEEFCVLQKVIVNLCMNLMNVVE